jgi:hypothetical protein
MSQPSAPDPPKDPAAYRPRPLLGLGFWGLLAFALVCILAGIAIAEFGPRLLAHRPGPRPPADTPALTDAAGPSSAPAPLAAAPPAPAPAYDVGRLDARVAALEAGQLRTAQTAAAALAAAAVVEATQSSGPFTDEIAGLRAVSAPSPELTALARLAEAGAPSRASLAASFPDHAAQAAAAARAPADGAGLGDRIVYALSRVISVRRVGDVPGGSADALLARAERLVDDGDLDRALRVLDRLPPKAREALGSWRARAERRAEIDRNAAALRARALQALITAAPPSPRLAG